MYSRSAFVLFTIFLFANKAGGKMAGDEDANDTLNDLDPQWPVKVIKCFEHKHVLRCFKTLLQEKTKTKGTLDKIREVAKVSVARKDSSSGRLSIKKISALLSVWEKFLSTNIQKEISEIFNKPNVFNVSDFAIRFIKENNATMGVALGNKGREIEGRKMKMQMGITKMIPFMLVPGLFLAGIMPWVVPQIKMLIMMVAMLNQVAFSSALFSMVRGYIFDTTQNEHVFYINHGYKNEKHHEKHHHGEMKHEGHGHSKKIRR